MADSLAEKRCLVDNFFPASEAVKYFNSLNGLFVDHAKPRARLPPRRHLETLQPASDIDCNQQRLVRLGARSGVLSLETLPTFIKTKIFDYLIPLSQRSLGIELRICFGLGFTSPTHYWTLTHASLPLAWNNMRCIMATSTQLAHDVLAFIVPSCDIAISSCAQWDTCVCDGLLRFQPLAFSIESIRTMSLPDHIWRQGACKELRAWDSRSVALLKWISRIATDTVLLIPDTTCGVDYPLAIPLFEQRIGELFPEAGKVKYWDPDVSSIPAPAWWEDNLPEEMRQGIE